MTLEEYIATMELKFIMFLENNSKVNVMHLCKTMGGLKGFQEMTSFISCLCHCLDFFPMELLSEIPRRHQIHRDHLRIIPFFFALQLDGHGGFIIHNNQCAFLLHFKKAMTKVVMCNKHLEKIKPITTIMFSPSSWLSTLLLTPWSTPPMQCFLVNVFNTLSLSKE